MASGVGPDLATAAHPRRYTSRLAGQRSHLYVVHYVVRGKYGGGIGWCGPGPADGCVDHEVERGRVDAATTQGAGAQQGAKQYRSTPRLGKHNEDQGKSEGRAGAQGTAGARTGALSRTP